MRSNPSGYGLCGIIGCTLTVMLAGCPSGAGDAGDGTEPSAAPAPSVPEASTPSGTGSSIIAPVIADIPNHNTHTGANYQFQCRLEQGSAPITWTVDGDAVPSGMTIGPDIGPDGWTVGMLRFVVPTGLSYYPYPFTVKVKAANEGGSDEAQFTLNVFEGSNSPPELVGQSIEGNLTEGESGYLTITCAALDTERDNVWIEADLSDFCSAAPFGLAYSHLAPYYGEEYGWDLRITPTQSGQRQIRLTLTDDVAEVVRYVPVNIKKRADNTGIVATMHANPDPKDPLICQLTNTSAGDTMAVFGQKNAQGVVTKVETLEIWKPGMDTKQRGYAMHLDDDGWPTTITAPNGDLAKLTYDGDNVTIEFYGADGSVAVATRQLQAGARADTKARMAALLKQQVASRIEVAADVPTTSLTILGQLALTVERDNEELGPLLNANVTGYCAQAESVSPAFFNSQTGMYEFYVRHRVKDLHVTANDCETYAMVAATFFGVVSIATGVVSAALPPAAAGAALMWAVLSGAASTFGIGVGYVGWKCEEMIYRAAEPGSVATVIVTVNLATFPGPKQAPPVVYNVYDLHDLIVEEKKFTTFLEVSDCSAIKMNLLKAEAWLANDDTNRALLCEAAGYRLELSDGDCVDPIDIVPLNLEEYRAQAAADRAKYCTDAPTGDTYQGTVSANGCTADVQAWAGSTQYDGVEYWGVWLTMPLDSCDPESVTITWNGWEEHTLDSWFFELNLDNVPGEEFTPFAYMRLVSESLDGWFMGQGSYTVIDGGTWRVYEYEIALEPK